MGFGKVDAHGFDQLAEREALKTWAQLTYLDMTRRAKQPAPKRSRDHAREKRRRQMQAESRRRNRG